MFKDSAAKSIKTVIANKNRQVMKNRMRNHFQRLQSDINQILDDINFETGNENAKLVHPIIDELKALNFKMIQLTEGLDKTFELFVVGMGNYGKSTLINALLEQEVADMDVRPKTWKVDVYDATLSDDTCLIVYRDGGSEHRSLEETKIFLEEEENKTKRSRQLVKSELKKVLSELKTKEAVKETEEYLKKEFLYQSDVVEVRWPINPTYLSKRFMVVDTPGLVQENLSGDTIVSVQKYYHQADGVIWILDATKLASKKSKDMVNELEKSLSKIGGKTDNIIAVLNRIDLVRKNGGEEAEQKVLDEANKHFGKYFENFICISAKQAFNGIMKRDKQQRSESGIDSLINAVDANFYENAQKVQLQSRELSYKQIIREVTEDSYIIKAYMQRLRKEQEEYIERKESIINRFNRIGQNYKSEFENITSSFLDSVEIRVNNHAQVLFDFETDREREEYIKDYLFCLDEFQTKLEKFHKFWLEEIVTSMNQLAAETVFTEYKHIDPEAINKMFKEINMMSKNNISYSLDSADIQTENLSLASGAGIAAIGGLIFGPFGLLLAGITSFLGVNKGIAKLFKSGNLKRKLNETIQRHVKDIKKSILDDLECKNKEAKGNVLNEFIQSFQMLHGPYESSLKIEKSLNDLYKAVERPIIYPDIKSLIVYENKKILA
ncbi:dynamin family protein [Falsibacillus albus]|uniref:dynamin family protein n=1 Tax=Falsibacillus albus TaxID=2478915 RepID=UPI0013145368|nr:dynamin family protein [Falsibacillus albus]